MSALLWVGLGGACGAVLRHAVGLGLRSLYGGPFPAATMVVNVAGCLAIGWALGNQASDPRWSEPMRAFGVIGFLGAFTTFSSFGLETVHLVQVGRVGAAFWSVALNLVLGLGAVVVGAHLAS